MVCGNFIGSCIGDPYTASPRPATALLLLAPVLTSAATQEEKGDVVPAEDDLDHDFIFQLLQTISKWNDAAKTRAKQADPDGKMRAKAEMYMQTLVKYYNNAATKGKQVYEKGKASAGAQKASALNRELAAKVHHIVRELEESELFGPSVRAL
eukprot:gene30954-56288_t